jgi:transglutaminase-like putative cysteine protease
VGRHSRQADRCAARVGAGAVTSWHPREMPDLLPAGESVPIGQEPLALTVGCEFALACAQATLVIMQVAPYPESGVTVSGERWDTGAEHHGYVDHYGNRCERFELSSGSSRIAYEAQVVLRSPADLVELDVRETPVELLPDDVLSFLMPSRFCLPDELGHEAWQRFGALSPGWGRVQAIVDYVHGYLEFVPGASNPWTTAADAYRAAQGVCRDFAHLAITFCRALNIPARYVFGYIPDMDIPAGPPEAMDFAAWFEVYLDGGWRTFDARNNRQRVGRVVVGRGRDAVDVALTTSFGPVTLTGFEVRAEHAALPAQTVQPSRHDKDAP